MNTSNTYLAALGLAVVSLLLTACGSNPARVEENFGNSVRQMMRAQTVNPDAASRRTTQDPSTTDGQMLEGALDAYRGESMQRGTVGGALDVGVGGGQ